ncbi:LysR family transcriptional regulator [Acinetobacter sp.]|uniref:LysR family transcriptional regulator n=1 Tax=Acinetobacter sp. TaxID=472 RepID=UPI002FCB4EEA
MIEKVSLNSLKFFYFVATFGSVTLAAEKLFVTQSAVSKQIKNLEENIGIALFERSNKLLLLTPEGKLLLSCCQKIFSQLEMCLIDLNQKNAEKNQLVLSCEPTLAMKWLIPRLSKFQALNYGFNIVLFTGGGAVDFDKSGIDLALRRDDFAWSRSIFSEKLADEYIVLAKSRKMEMSQTLLVSKSRPDFYRKLYKNKAMHKIIAGCPVIEFEHFHLCLEGCLSGLGSTVISIYMIEKELEYGFLANMAPAFKDGSAYHLLSNTPFEHDCRKAMFMQWLKKEMMDSQAKILALQP